MACHRGNSVVVFTLLVCALLLSEILACNTHNKFNKQDRYYRRHNYRRVFGKRNADDYKKYLVKRSANYESKPFTNVKTTCGGALCDSVLNYPLESISNAVSQLRRIYELKKTSSSEKINPSVMHFLSAYLKSETSSVEFPEIIYGEIKGCQTFENVTFPQEGYSKDDGRIYHVVNVPDLQQKVTSFTCKKSKKECGNNVALPPIYSRTCQQVYREEEFLVLPSDSSEYSVADFRIRTFIVPDGCRCILLKNIDI